jgi:hypothetical protein
VYLHDENVAALVEMGKAGRCFSPINQAPAHNTLANLLEAPPPGRKLFLTLLTAKKAAAMKDILVRSSPSRAHGGL